MEPFVSLKGNRYTLCIGEDEIVLGAQGGLSDQNIQEMLEIMYGQKRNQLALRPQGGLSPENIQEMLDALYRCGAAPTAVVLTFRESS